MQLNSNHTLYISPINFSDLIQLGKDQKYYIKLLVAFPEGSMKAAYIDNYKLTKEFEEIGRFATLNSLCEVLRKNHLIIYEYILETDNYKLQSLIGNDVQVTFKNFGRNESRFIKTVLDGWKILNLEFDVDDIFRMKTNTLFNFSKNGMAQVEKKIESPDKLMDYLYEDEQEQLWSDRPFRLQYRIYLC